jgi:hypothetical protein
VFVLNEHSQNGSSFSRQSPVVSFLESSNDLTNGDPLRSMEVPPSFRMDRIMNKVLRKRIGKERTRRGNHSFLLLGCGLCFLAGIVVPGGNARPRFRRRKVLLVSGRSRVDLPSQRSPDQGHAVGEIAMASVRGVPRVCLGNTTSTRA